MLFRSALLFLFCDSNTRLPIHSLHCFTAIIFLCFETATKAHQYSYSAFSMPKAERRRWIELHLSRHPETSAFLPKIESKNRKKTRYRKSTSFEDDEVVPFPIYESQSHDHLLEVDRPLLSLQNSCFDDHDFDNDSADWDWEKNMADDVDEARPPTTSLFGAAHWRSFWPSKTVMKITDAVNVSVLVAQGEKTVVIQIGRAHV